MTFATALALLATCGAVEPDGAAKTPSPWQPYFRDQSERYVLTVRGPEETVLKPLDEPLLRWSQPVRGGDSGAVYLWTAGGRPAAIVSMLAWPHPEGHHVVQHEWHSLADAPLTAELGGSTLWRPAKAGVEWKPLPGSQQPAGSAAARLVQMRRLARRFTATSVNPSDGDSRWDLRLLPQPLHQFGGDSGGAAATPEAAAPAGGLFALAQGTDPEVLLLLEASPPGSPEPWRYAVARMSDRTLRVSLDGEEVWSAGRPQWGKAEAEYYVVVVEKRRPPTPTGTEGEK